MAAISTLAKYDGDGSWQWFIPFPYSSPSDVAVKIIKGGKETRLAIARDFQVQDQSVIRVVPEGEEIVIWLDGSLAEAKQVAANKSLSLTAAAPVAASLAPVAPSFGMATYSLRDTAVDDTSVPTPADDVVSELKARVLALENDKANSLAEAQITAKDAQIQAIAETGEAQTQAIKLASLDSKTQIDTAAEQALQKITESQNSLTLLTANLQEDVSNAKASVAVANESAVQAQNSLAAYSSRATATVASSANSAVTDIETARDKAIADIKLVQTQAQDRINVLASLSSNVQNADGFVELGEPVDPEGIILLPAQLAYYPNRSMLVVYRNGMCLVHGLEFDEVGSATRLSNTIRIHFQANAGDTFAFWIVASNISAKAEEAGKRAENSALDASHSQQHACSSATNASKSATSAANSAKQASSTLSQAREQAQDFLNSAKQEAAGFKNEGQKLLDAAQNKAVLFTAQAQSKANSLLTESERLQSEAQIKAQSLLGKAHRENENLLTNAQNEANATREKAKQQARYFLKGMSKASGSWMDAVEDLAEEVFCLAAWSQHAAQWMSLQNSQPGISMVRDIVELDHAASGLYIFNPKLLNAPTQFLGVVPCEDFDNIGDFDGCYILGTEELTKKLGQLNLPENPIPKPAKPFPDFTEYANGVDFDWQPRSNGDAGGSWLPADCRHCSNFRSNNGS